MLVPVVGLYYLFIHREELIRAGARQFVWGKFLRRGRVVNAGVMTVLGGGIAFAMQNHEGILFSIIYSIAAAVGVLGALALVLDWSLACTLFGLGLFVYGIYPGQNDYLKDLGMVVTLFGIVLLMTGWDVMRIAWFPIAFLVCAIPWPGLVYSWIAEPLQTMAAKVAVHVLQMTGVDSNTSGTKIVIGNSNPALPPRVLNVAEACAGMRSLMTFIAVGGAIAFLSPRPLWQRVIIVISSIPIAIFCNVMRISGQGLLDHYVSPQWSESFAHQFVGMMMLLPAFFLILGVGYVLDQLFIEEAEEGEAGFVAAPKPAAAVATRETLIPALGVMSSAPKAIVTAPVVPARPAVVPPTVTQQPAVATPPRPFTAANLRPVTNGTPVSPGRKVPPQNGVAPRPITPPRSASTPPPYKPLDPTAPRRPPVIKPTVTKPKDTP